MGSTTPTSNVSKASGVNAAEAPKPTAPKHRLRNFLIGTTMVATLAGGFGGFFGPGAAAVQKLGPDTGVVRMEQVDTTAKKPFCAPATMQDMQTYGDSYLMERVCFDRAPTVEADFGRTPVKFESFNGDETRTANGVTVHHSFQQDILKTLDGQTLYSSPTETAVRGAFQNEGESNWTSSSQLQPAGQVKNFLSVLVTDKGQTGGSDQLTQSLVTIDAQTGQRVTLQQLIEPQDFNKVVDQVAASLNSPRGSDYQMGSRQELADQVNQNFAVYKDIDGSFKFRVIVPAQTQANHGKVAEFSFAAENFLQ